MRGGTRLFQTLGVRTEGVNARPDCGSGRAKELSPVAFNENPATVPVLPSGSDPDGVRARRQFPSAPFPDVSTAIPSVIAADPDVAPAGSGSAALDYSRRWPLPHENLRGLRGSDPHNNSKTR